jgi:VWFA-related protein
VQTRGQSEPIRPDEQLEERAKVRVRTARIRIEPGRLSTPGECLQLGVEDLKVTLRGKRIEDPSALRLEREPQRAVHALLIDTSGSMYGELDDARRAASAYVERLRPGLDRALVATFDETVVLVEGLTSDRDRLIRQIDGIRMAGFTSMLDALYYSMLELRAQRDRPVIVVLTDGVDTASLHERQEVLDLVEKTPQLSVFSIGLGLPYAMKVPVAGARWWQSPPGGSRGINTTKRFLQLLSERTNGRFFDVSASSKLERVFLRVREMLENEATLSVTDPDPDAPPGRLKVASRNPDCTVHLFNSWEPLEDDPSRAPILDLSDELPHREPLPALRILPVTSSGSRKLLADPACREVFRTATDLRPGASPDGFVEIDEHGMHGCREDVTMQYGTLYDPEKESWTHRNDWIGLKTRPFEMTTAMVAGLPNDPVSLMDTLAEMALEVADEPIQTDPRLVPVEAHARPYHDLPCFVDGSAFLEIRPQLARAMYARPDYRVWVLDRLRRDSAAAMAELEDRYRRRFPDTPEELLKEVVRETDEGREILALARAPAEIDLQRYLGAWLGDVSAHDLFVGWEVELVNRALASRTAPDLDSTLGRWIALRDVLFVPSYTRVLALTAPGYDPSRDRVGYWRVVLPRPAWLLTRVQGFGGELDVADLPLDLIPDRPFALWLVGHLQESHPDLVNGWRERGYRVRSIRYELTGERRTWAPQEAFKEHRIEVTLEDEAGTRRGRLVADLDLGKKKRKTRIVRLHWAPTGGSPRDLLSSRGK